MITFPFIFYFFIFCLTFLGSGLDFYITIVKPFQNASRLLMRAKNLLKQSNCFSNLELISSARIPILRCVHIPTGFKCDLNITNNGDVYNGEIMTHLLKFDKRIYILAIVVKFWMKSHNLIGSNRMSSFSTLWLLLFYLQQLKDPVLPPMKDFLKDGASFFISTANSNFIYGLPNLQKNNDPLFTLLLGFFEFYEKFDFKPQLISPLPGRSFPNQNFQNPQFFRRFQEMFGLLPKRKSMQINKPICIQDPFDMWRTTPGTMSRKDFNIFVNAIANAARLFRSKKLRATGEGKELLLALFDSDIILMKVMNNKIQGFDLMVKICASIFFLFFIWICLKDEK